MGRGELRILRMLDKFQETIWMKHHCSGLESKTLEMTNNCGSPLRTWEGSWIDSWMHRKLARDRKRDHPFLLYLLFQEVYFCAWRMLVEFGEHRSFTS